MYMPYNAYEIEQARRQQKLEDENRERLAKIARPQPSRIASLIKAIRGVLSDAGITEHETPLMAEAAQSPTNG